MISPTVREYEMPSLSIFLEKRSSQGFPKRRERSNISKLSDDVFKKSNQFSLRSSSVMQNEHSRHNQTPANIEELQEVFKQTHEELKVKQIRVHKLNKDQLKDMLIHNKLPPNKEKNLNEDINGGICIYSKTNQNSNKLELKGPTDQQLKEMQEQEIEGVMTKENKYRRMSSDKQKQKQVPITNYLLNLDQNDEPISTRRNKSMTMYDSPLRSWRPTKPNSKLNNISRGSRMSNFSQEDHQYTKKQLSTQVKELKEANESQQISSKSNKSQKSLRRESDLNKIKSSYGKKKLTTESKFETNDIISNNHFMAPRVSVIETNDYEAPSKVGDFSFKKKRLTNNDVESKVSSLLIKKTTSQGVTPHDNLDQYLMLTHEDLHRDQLNNKSALKVDDSQQKKDESQSIFQKQLSRRQNDKYQLPSKIKSNMEQGMLKNSPRIGSTIIKNKNEIWKINESNDNEIKLVNPESRNQNVHMRQCSNERRSRQNASPQAPFRSSIKDQNEKISSVPVTDTVHNSIDTQLKALNKVDLNNQMENAQIKIDKGVIQLALDVENSGVDDDSKMDIDFNYVQKRQSDYSIISRDIPESNRSQLKNPIYQEITKFMEPKQKQNMHEEMYLSKDSKISNPMSRNMKLDFASVMNAQSFSFGRTFAKFDLKSTQLRKSDSVDSLVDDQLQTEDIFRGTLSPLDDKRDKLTDLQSQLHSQMTNYLQHQILSKTEEQFKQLLKKPGEKWLGVKQSNAVFGNTRLILDGDNSKVIQEKRYRQMAQLQREIKIGMYLKDLQAEEKIQDRINCLLKNDFDNYKRRYILEKNATQSIEKNVSYEDQFDQSKQKKPQIPPKISLPKSKAIQDTDATLLTKQQDLLNSYDEYMTTKSLMTRRSMMQPIMSQHPSSDHEQIDNLDISMHQMEPVLKESRQEEHVNAQQSKQIQSNLKQIFHLHKNISKGVVDMPVSRVHTNTGSNGSADQTEKFDESHNYIDKPNLSKSIGGITSNTKNQNLKNLKMSIRSIDSLTIKEKSKGVQSNIKLKQVTPNFKPEIQKNSNESAQFTVNNCQRAFSQQTARPRLKTKEDLILQRLQKLHNIGKINGVITNVSAINNLQYQRIKRGPGVSKIQRKKLDELNAYILAPVAGERRYVLNNRSVQVTDTQSLQILSSSPNEQTELTVVRDDDDDQEIQEQTQRVKQEEAPQNFDYDFDLDQEMDTSNAFLRNSASSLQTNPYLAITPLKKRLGPSKLMSELASSQQMAMLSDDSREGDILNKEQNIECRSALTQTIKK